MAIASTFGQVVLQVLLAIRAGRLVTWCWPSSRLSSPAIAESLTPLVPVLSAMTPHLLTQPVGHVAGQLGHLNRVDTPRPGSRHLILVNHPARSAAEQHDPVAEPGGFPDVVRDEKDGQRPLRTDPLELVVQQVARHRVKRAEWLI